MAEMAAPRGGSVAVTALSLQRRSCFYGQCVYVGFEQFRHGGVDQPVTGQGRKAAERCGHDLDAKMTTSVGRAGVSGVQVALVDYVKESGREAALQPLPQPSFAVEIGHQARSGVAGLILLLNHSACGMTNTIVAPVMPNTLKLTQTFSAKLRAI